MATLRERRPGVSEIRVFTGPDATGKPTQISKTVLAAAEQLFPPIGLYAGLGTSPDELTARFGAALDAESISDLRARGAALDFDETLALARSALARVANADGGP